MHQCLRVDEIIRLVACELVESKGYGTAAALARCCKNLEDPVFDALREAQNRLTPLLKRLPQDTWEEAPQFVSRLIAFAFSVLVNQQIRKTFKRTPTRAEWTDFRKYALRMRNLELVVSEDLGISDILLVQQSHTTNDSWLPRLQAFACDCATEELIPLIPFSLSPRTTDITIGFDEDAPAAVIVPMVMRLPTLCPDMNEIGLDPLPRDPAITEAASEILLACKRDHLVAFLVDSPLTEEAREVVYRLPKLTSLCAVIEGRTLLPPVALPNLRDILLKFDGDLDWLQ